MEAETGVSLLPDFEGIEPCQLLDVVYLTSRIYISVVLSYQVGGNFFLWQPQATNTMALQYSESWHDLDQLDTSTQDLDALMCDTKTMKYNKFTEVKLNIHGCSHVSRWWSYVPKQLACADVVATLFYKWCFTFLACCELPQLLFSKPSSLYAYGFYGTSCFLFCFVLLFQINCLKTQLVYMNCNCSFVTDSGKKVLKCFAVLKRERTVFLILMSVFFF